MTEASSAMASSLSTTLPLQRNQSRKSTNSNKQNSERHSVVLGTRKSLLSSFFVGRYNDRQITKSSSRSTPLSSSLSLKRRYPFGRKSPNTKPTSTPTSPLDTRPKLNSYNPSFTKIFDMDVDMLDCEPSTDSCLHFLTKQLTEPTLNNSSTDLLELRASRHQHHDSTSTISATSSSNSSPTTTISTTSNDDRSPSTSPDSPKSILPLSAFGTVSKSPKLSIENLHKMSTSVQGSTYRSLSPIKKPRNTKNLSLNMLNSTRSASSQTIVSPGLSSSRASSAPSSPGFIPPTMPRRRPSNLGLTIKLPGGLPDKTSSLRVGALQSRPSLRHHVSSPSLFSPAPGRPPRLMSPPPANPSESLSSSMSSSHLSSSPPDTSGPIIEMDEEDMLMMENDGEGPKSPAYPEGPVCIYEPNIFLFAEPNADLARTFDVVINVAREVHNPFDVEEAKRRADAENPTTASSCTSFATAFEEPLQSKRPEYLHIPWDHNTSILSDLPQLVELLQKRSAEGKRILVHCQCGVSRSASLIVAYGLFSNSQQTVQEAYDFVKERSRWIGPNMSLIYQLSDWRAKITTQKSRRGKARGAIETRPKLGHNSRSANSSDPTPFNRENMEEVPMTAPLPNMRQMNTSPVEERQPVRTRTPPSVRTRNDNGDMIMGIEAGPMSAPPGMMNIPCSQSVQSRGAGWGSGDAGPRYIPPSVPSHAAYPLGQESDVVGDIVGFPATRIDDYDGMPPPTPSFGPSGGFRFEQPLLKAHRKKRTPLNMSNMENIDEPPPTPSLSGPKGGFFGSMMQPPKSRLSEKSLTPSFKKPDLPHHVSNEPTRYPLSNELTTTIPVSQLSKTGSIKTPLPPAQPHIRKIDAPSRPNPEFHRRFPSIMSSFQEEPTSNSIADSYFPPVRMPSITSHRSKSSLKGSSAAGVVGMGRGRGGPLPGSSSIMMDDILSPEAESPTPAFFQDPRSPNTGRGAMPTTRSIFDVL